ncbi:MAG: tetratricopeptide repeat protein [Chitinivibrionales bacterium]|nr:tetratricopeptide repeat protein [Chitinivibrionales bacterium]
MYCRIVSALAALSTVLSLRAMAETETDSAEVLYREALQLEQYGNIVEARATYTRALSRAPERGDIRYRRGVCTWRMLQDPDVNIPESAALPETARVDLARAIAADTANSNAFYYRGLLTLHYTDSARVAVRELSRAIALNPRFADAYRARARAYLKADAGDSAVGDWQRAIELAPHDHRIYRQRAEVYADLGQFDKALQDLNKVLSIVAGPYSRESERLRGDAFKARGDALLRLDRFDEAKADHRKASAALGSGSVPGIAHSWTERGTMKAREGNHETSVALFTYAIELTPDHTRAYAGRASSLFALGRHEPALADCDVLVTRNPESFYDRALRARVLEKLGRASEALAEFETALKLARGAHADTDSLQKAVQRLRRRR